VKPALLRSVSGRELLERLSSERGIDPDIINDVLEALNEHAGMLRRRGLFQRFDTIFDKDRD
jgi:hypothetical protein